MNWKELEAIGRDLNEVISPDLPGVIEEMIILNKNQPDAH
jgi:hypothetical protein